MLHGLVDQLKLIVIKSRHREQSMFYHAGKCQHIENTQINKVIGENEKCVFYLMEKVMDFLANPITLQVDCNCKIKCLNSVFT